MHSSLKKGKIKYKKNIWYILFMINNKENIIKEKLFTSNYVFTKPKIIKEKILRIFFYIFYPLRRWG